MSEYIYYVYAYLRKKDNTPYYIGKGSKWRAYAKHCVSVPKNRSKIVFWQKGLLEKDAIVLEKAYIKLYGRKDLKTGILRNRTDGGEGIGSFWKGKKRGVQSPRSNKWCKNISKAKSGIPKSEKHKENMSIAQSGMWQIIPPNNKPFIIRSLTKFCKENKLSRACMLRVAKGNYNGYKSTHHRGYKCVSMTHELLF